jgi:hypothetical protein
LRRRKRTTVPERLAPPAPDLVQRGFHARKLNEKWCGDITPIPRRCSHRAHRGHPRPARPGPPRSPSARPALPVTAPRGGGSAPERLPTAESGELSGDMPVH